MSLIPRPSHQLYTLHSETNESFTLRELSSEIPRKLKAGETGELSFSAQLDTGGQQRGCLLSVDLESGNLRWQGTREQWRRDAEYARLEAYLWRCQINYLRALKNEGEPDTQDILTLRKLLKKNR